ncbi:Protein CBG27867 [Caenorhabditis briggsae]|uniref:Protein CBG27867 n=1 Tax=Caenorhabditis briggsae TaxID=6238 RepID=B6IEG2_CAEBR|nr:Protein CBG27867 [Caenorhabditis briggsae]CAR98292.1 Protein CBG27867 [Caenorhabditis briggsae]
MGQVKEHGFSGALSNKMGDPTSKKVRDTCKKRTVKKKSEEMKKYVVRTITTSFWKGF